MRVLPIILAVTLTITMLASVAAAEDHWDIQYQYRQADSTLTIGDMTFPDQTHGIACGFTTDRKDKDHPLVILTSDGGTNWTEAPVKESCLSLFFLEDSTGWMVTNTGLWFTQEAGRAWVKSKTAPANLLRVWFLDRDHGFAAGREKHVYETKDAGVTWMPVEIAATAPGDAVYTTYGDIAFSGNKGIISGWNVPPRRGGPDWMEPAQAEAAKQVPHVSILLQTKDAGATWKEQHVSLFGQITRMSLSAENVGLGLVEFKDAFEYPAEIYRIDLTTGNSSIAYRAKDRAITDIRLFSGSHAILAGYAVNGPIYRSPIPGKLHVLTTSDMEKWTEMTVDYKAVAHAALITGPDEQHLWIATDTGMILSSFNNS